MADTETPQGPDLRLGVPLSDIPADGVLVGRVGDAAVMLARTAEGVQAFDAHCTHYHGPLGEGLRVGDTIRCPWHHACFSLNTGRALRAPAFAALERWKVETRRGQVFVKRKDKPASGPLAGMRGKPPGRVVIVGGGAAGFAAAERLRGMGYGGRITMLSDDASAPYDRPNLSKDYLAGTAPEDWIPLRDAAWYRKQKIALKLGARVTEIAIAGRSLTTADGRKTRWDALLLATGAEPIRLSQPNEVGPNVFYLRTLADSRAIIARAAGARRVVIVGASFIGLEVAASLNARGLDVHVVDGNPVPMAKALGPELGRFVQGLHEAHGVRFHLGRLLAGVDTDRIRLDDGSEIQADFAVLGMGVKPRVELARAAGLEVDGGVIVDDCLRTSAPGVFAAGDIAAWPDALTGERTRVEHWVHAERQGQVAAANILGADIPFTDPPFFWSAHYGTEIRYCGHAAGWDRVEIDGSLEAKDAEVRYLKGGVVRAVATVGRDKACLERAAGWEAQAAR